MTPNANESKEDFVKRCIPILIKEGKSQDEAVAVCNSMYTQKDNEAKEYFDTVDIQGVEIFRTGKWNNDKYTVEDLQDIADNFKILGNRIKPYVKLGHDPKQELLQKNGYPAAGWITNVYRDGESLKADFSKMPKKIKDLIDAKAYGRFSPEIYWNLKTDGKKYKRALKAVALLGGDTPACTTMDDFINLYGMEADNIQYASDVDAETKNPLEVTKVEEKDYTQEIKEKDNQIKEYESKIADNEKAIAEKDELLKKYEEEKAEIEAKHFTEKVDSAIDGWVKDGKITPAQQKLYRMLIVDEKVYEEDGQKVEFKDNFEVVKSLMENKVAEINQTEVSTTGEDKIEVKDVEDDGYDKKLYEEIERVKRDNPSISDKDVLIQASENLK